MTVILEKYLKKKKDIERLINSFRDKKINEKLINSNIKVFENLSKMLDEANIIIAKEKLKIKVNNINKFVDDFYDLLEQLKDFKGNHLLSAGGRTKKYKEFLENIKTNLRFYEYVASDGIEIHVYDDEGNKFLIKYKDGNYEPCANYSKLDFEKIYIARKKRNSLLEKFRELRLELTDNYRIATGDYCIEDFNIDSKIQHI